MEQQYKDCYVQLDMIVKPAEMFDENGKFIFISKAVKSAVLHAAQANNQGKLHTIKKMMWEQLLKEKGWKIPNKTNFLSLCEFTEKRIPRYSKPISFNI